MNKEECLGILNGSAVKESMIGKSVKYQSIRTRRKGMSLSGVVMAESKKQVEAIYISKKKVKKTTRK